MAGKIAVTHNLSIDGTLYMGTAAPDIPIDISSEQTIAPKITTAANRSIQDMHDLTVRQYTAWHEGAFQSLYGTEAPFSANKYNNSSGIKVSDAGKISLLNIMSLTAFAAVSGYYTPPRIYDGHAFFGVKKTADSKYYVFTEDIDGAESYMLGPNNGAAMSDVAPAEPYIFASAGALYRKAYGASNAWSGAVQTSANSYYPLIYHNGYLWGARDGAGSTSYFDRITTANPAVVATKWTVDDKLFLDLCVHQNSLLILVRGYTNSNKPEIYVVNTDETVSLWSTLPKGFSPNYMVSYQGVLYIMGDITIENSVYPCVYYFVGSVGPTLLHRNENAGGYSYVLASGYLNDVFLIKNGELNADDIGALRYGLDDGGISPYLKSGSIDTYIIGGKINSSDGFFRLYSLSGYYKESSTKVASGWLTQGMDYFSMPTQKKIYTKAEVVTEPLPAGSTVKVYYRLDSQSSFTLLGTHSGTNATYSSFELKDGSGNFLQAYGIELKVELYRATTATVSPVVTSFGYFFAPILDQKHTFKFAIPLDDNVTLLNGESEPRTASEMLAALEASLAKPVFAFKNSDWSTATYTAQLMKKRYLEYNNGQKLLYLELKEI